LQDLACLAIDEGRAISVTLVVSGGVIGGTVESGREVSARTAEELHGSHGLSELFDPAAGPIPALTRWERERERETFGSYDSTAPSSRLLRYLHLRDATYAVPGQLPISLGHTRVLLSQLSAWTVGYLDLDPTLR
jgi:hypothetical protein